MEHNKDESVKASTARITASQNERGEVVIGLEISGCSSNPQLAVRRVANAVQKALNALEGQSTKENSHLTSVASGEQVNKRLLLDVMRLEHRLKEITQELKTSIGKVKKSEGHLLEGVINQLEPLAHLAHQCANAVEQSVGRKNNDRR